MIATSSVCYKCYMGAGKYLNDLELCLMYSKYYMFVVWFYYYVHHSCDHYFVPFIAPRIGLDTW